MEFPRSPHSGPPDPTPKVVQKCLIGGEELGLYDGADETDPQVGAETQRIFVRDLVDRLRVIRL